MISNVTNYSCVMSADSKEQQKDTGVITVFISVVRCVLLNIMRKKWRDEDANGFSNKCDQQK